MSNRILDRLTGVSAAALLGAALLAAPVGASAQSTQAAPQEAAPAPSMSAPATPAPSMSAPAAKAKRHTTPMRRVEAQIKRLHSQLMITADQSAEWDAVAQVMRDQAEEMEHLAQQRIASRGTMTAVDDLKSYQAITDAHAEEMRKLVPAFQTLYDAMSPEQKKNADAVFAHRPAASKRKSG